MTIIEIPQFPANLTFPLTLILVDLNDNTAVGSLLYIYFSIFKSGALCIFFIYMK